MSFVETSLDRQTSLDNVKLNMRINKDTGKKIVKNNQPYLILNDGNQMPMFGLGTWNSHGKEVKDAVRAAIELGYRHIDTATNYRNEGLIGEAISECIKDGLLKREELFVTTKLWNNSHSRGSVIPALKASLEALQLDYLDLYLIHYPIGYKEGAGLAPMDAGGQVITSDVDYLETWQGMEDAKRAGLTKSIGVSNFNAQQIRRLVNSCNYVPAINQIENHPYLTQEDLIDLCRSLKIELTGYSPLGSPGKRDPRLEELYLMDDPVVVALAKKYRRPVAHILIAFQIQRGLVCIPKALRLANIESNIKALDLVLSEEDINKLRALNVNHRFMKFERCLNHKYYPFN